MKHLYTFFCITFLLCLGYFPAQGQQGVVTTGGEASGPGGSMSFSTGQTDFSHFYDQAGSIQFGLQQPFFFGEDDPGVPESQSLSTEDILAGEDQCFDATQTLVLAGGTDDFIVEAGTGVQLVAGESIHMLPGTHVQQGGYLHAQITTDGFYCEEGEQSLLATDDPVEDKSQQGTEADTEMADLNREEDFFRVYPNPTRGDLTLELPGAGFSEETVTIEVLGMRGEVIKRQVGSRQDQFQLSLAGQQPGLYMIRVQMGDEMGVERIVKR